MLKAIIADDDAVFVRYVQQCVDWQVLNVTVVGCTHNGAATIELCRQHRPEILVLDVEMPHYTGLQCLERLRAEGMDSQVLLITGRDEFRYAQEGAKLGVYDILLKPVSISALERTLHRLVNRYWALQVSDCVLQYLAGERGSGAEILALLDTETTGDSVLNLCNSILYAVRGNKKEELRDLTAFFLDHTASLSLPRRQLAYLNLFPVLACSALLRQYSTWAQLPVFDREISQLLQMNGTQDTAQVEAILCHVFQRSSAALHGMFSERRNPAEEMLEYMRKHFSEAKLSVADIADQMHFHETYLRRLFKMTYNKTPSQMLREIRMNEAKKLLESRDIQIQQVSRLVGIDDPAYFSKCYKQHFGHAPSSGRTP